MSFKIIIPARYASTRLPGKPLLDIAGKPMLQHVYERAIESEATEVIIATDDDRIKQSAKSFGAKVCMTKRDHASGTDRLAEVASIFQFNDDHIIVNLQGDEPCLPSELINQVAADLAQNCNADIATLYSRITQLEQVFDPNIVKVILDIDGYALYFSRAPIPWIRDHFSKKSIPDMTLPHYRHIGLYAYRTSFLTHYAELSSSLIEQAESLEQLRALFHGKKIHLSEAKINSGHGVDTMADLLLVRSLLEK